MIKSTIRNTAYAVAPGPVRRLDRWWWEGKMARALVAEAAGCSDSRALYRAVRKSMFWPEQNESEILGLMQMLSEKPPRYVCEIGAARGGNLFLFAQSAAPDALLVSVDIDFAFARPSALQKLGRARQRIRCIEADSQLESTRDQVRSLLSGNPLDFLFIDGDHSYDGVKRDFELYAPLVRPGGIIALHDIVADYKTRHGRDTGTYTGGVPIYWRELKDGFPDHRELIDNPDQDGLGIGVTRKTLETQN